MKKEKCEHKEFKAQVNVIRLEDSKRFIAEIHIHCVECGTPFQFMGLPLGVNYEGAAMEVDGLEARLAIAPQGEIPHPLGNRMKGFTIEKRVD